MICVNWCRIIIILLWSLCWFSLLQIWTLDGARLLKQKVCVWEEKIIASYQSVCYLYFAQANMLHHLNLHYCFQIWKTKMSVPWIIILTLARTSLFSQLFSLIFSPFYWFLIAFVCLSQFLMLPFPPSVSITPTLVDCHHCVTFWLRTACVVIVVTVNSCPLWPLPAVDLDCQPGGSLSLHDAGACIGWIMDDRQ